MTNLCCKIPLIFLNQALWCALARDMSRSQSSISSTSNASWSTTIVHNTQLSMQKKTHQNDKSSSRRENSQRVRDSNAVYWQRKLLYFPLHWKNTTTVYLLEKKLQPFYYFHQQIRSPLPVFHIFKQLCRKNRGKNKLEQDRVSNADSSNWYC